MVKVKRFSRTFAFLKKFTFVFKWCVHVPRERRPSVNDPGGTEAPSPQLPHGYRCRDNCTNSEEETHQDFKIISTNLSPFTSAGGARIFVTGF